MKLRSYLSPKTIIKPSTIVGRGLFANTAITKGEIVCIKAGHFLTKAELRQHKDVVNDAELQIADDLFIAPLSAEEFEDTMMFLNHSCDPNVGVQGQIVFVALCDIAAGEELALDYATIDHDCDPMPCRCGTANCRGVITGQDWRKPELQRKYGHYFAWHLLEKMRTESSTPVEPHAAC